MAVPASTADPSGPRPPRFASAAAATLATRFAVAFLSFVSVLIVARALGPAGRGDVALLTTIAMVSSQLGRMGVEEANVNIAGAEPRTRAALATNSLMLALLLGGLSIALLAPLVAAFPALGGETEAAHRWLALASIPLLILQAYLTFLVRADYRFGVTNVSWLLGPGLTVLANAVLWPLGLLTVGTAFGAWVGAHAVATLLLLWYLTRRLEGFGRPDAGLARRTIGFGVRAHLGRVMLVGNYRIDQWFVGAIAGSRELGLYSIAVAWAEVLFYLPTVLVIVQRPYLVRSKLEEAARRAARVFRVGLSLTLPLAAGMLLLAPFLCETIFGTDFAGSVDDLRLLSLGAFGVVALQQLGNALTAQRLPTLATVAAGIAFAATLTFDILLIPRYGGAGAAAASTLAYTAGGLVVVALFLRSFGIRAADLVPRPSEWAAVSRETWSVLARRSS